MRHRYIRPLMAPLLFLLCVGHAGAQQPHYTAHEWGTFTSLYGSDGQQLNDIYREEEELPNFVYKLQGSFPDIPVIRLSVRSEAGEYVGQVRLENVNVKMETPVIYFYADDSLTVDVNVRFRDGLIGQWYPRCSQWPQVSRKKEALSAVQPLNGTYVNDVVPLPSLDFARLSNEAGWRVKVLAPGSNAENKVSKGGETHTWTAPRETDANVLQAGIEYEKYIFYRGLGHFTMPVKVSFDMSGQLKIENIGTERIPYLFVYDRKENGEALVYWTGGLEPGASQQVHVDVISEHTFTEKVSEFREALVQAGLYKKEAAAMLNTWSKSYFSKTGLRVFWIAPEAFTNSIIPLQMNPAPEKLVRVLVGRSEIIKPAFEKEMYGGHITQQAYEQDRFGLAWQNRLIYLKNHPQAMDSVSRKIANQAATNAEYEQVLKTENIRVYPNPARNMVTVAIEHPQSGQATFILSDMTGKEVLRQATANIPSGLYSRQFDLSSLPAGFYSFQVLTASQNFCGKVVKE